MWDAGTRLRLLFRYVQVVKKSTFHLRHVHPSFYSHISAWIPLGVFCVKFDIGAFFNICEEKWKLLNIRQKYWAIHMIAYEHIFVASDISLTQKLCFKTLSIFIMLEVTTIIQQGIFSLRTVFQSMQRIWNVLFCFLLYILRIVVSELIKCKGRHLNLWKYGLCYFFYSHCSLRWCKGNFRNFMGIITTLTSVVILFTFLLNSSHVSFYIFTILYHKIFYWVL
jgi:hypothetical protein